MSRLLPLLGLLAACASSDRSEVTSSYRTLDAWLDTWLEARRCLVGDAPDSLTGVTIGTLTGRDCSRPTHQLELQIVTEDAAVNRVWRHAIDHFTAVTNAASLATRANAIDDTDAVARALGLAIGRWIPAMERGHGLPLLPEATEMFGGQEVLPPSFNSGFPYAFQMPPADSDAMAVGVDRLGNRLLYKQTIDDSRRPVPLARFDDGVQTRIIWTVGDRSFAYGIDIRSKGGATQTTYVPGKLLYQQQNAKTGDLVMYVRYNDKSFLHRFSARNVAAVVEETRFRSEFGFQTSCIHEGDVWGLRRTTTEHLTSQQPWFAVLGEVSKEMQLDCRRGTALVLRHDPDVLERCDDEECKPVFSANSYREGFSALLDDGRWVYVAELDGIVALWIEGDGKPGLYRLRRQRELRAITVDRGEVMLVSRDRMRYWGVTLPTNPSIRPVTAESRTQP